MDALKRISTFVLAGILVVIVQPLHGLAQQTSEASKNSLQVNGTGNTISISRLVLGKLTSGVWFIR